MVMSMEKMKVRTDIIWTQGKYVYILTYFLVFGLIMWIRMTRTSTSTTLITVENWKYWTNCWRNCWQKSTKYYCSHNSLCFWMSFKSTVHIEVILSVDLMDTHLLSCVNSTCMTSIIQINIRYFWFRLDLEDLGSI